MAVNSFYVSNRGEWGRFFVHEHEPIVDGDTIRYAATWCALTSFGTYGHYWSHMGSPFAQFIADINAEYLLRKVGRDVFDAKTLVESVREQIKARRRDQRITKEVARDGMDYLKRVADEYGPGDFSMMLYESVEMSHCKLEWCDLSSRTKDPEAVRFVDVLWPEFVRQVVGAAAEPATA